MIHSESAPGSLPTINGATPSTTETTTATEATPKPSSTAGELLYDGSKNYWRSRTNVDIKIVEHPKLNLLEVICFNIDTHQEDSSRIYVNGPLLYTKLSKSEIEEKIERKKEEFVRQRKKVPTDELTRTYTRESAANYITSRLQIIVDSANPSVFHMGLIPMIGDETVEWLKDSFLLNEEGVEENIQTTCNILDIEIKAIPATLEPLFIVRRRKTTAADFQNTLGALRADAQSLSQAMNKAQRAAGLMVSSVDGFKNMVQHQRHSIDPENFSIAKARWLRAGRRVLLQNYVDKVRARLERNSLSALPSESVSKTGAALKSQLLISLPPSLKSTSTLPSLMPIDNLSSSKTLNKQASLKGKRNK